MQNIWRDPPEETVDIYPGITVLDNRQSGSLTIGQSRLPVWAVIPNLVYGGWKEVLKGWDYIEERYDFVARDMVMFLVDITNLRGEFARLVALLAACERKEEDKNEAAWEAHKAEAHADAKGSITCECGYHDPSPWWNDAELATPLIEQMQTCLDILKENVDYQDEDLPL